jgi:hypothetical protein
MDFSFEDPEMLFSDDLWTSAFGLMIFSVASYIFLFAVLNEYVKEYIKNDGKSIEVGALWSAVKNTLSDYALSIILYAIILTGFLVAVGFTIAIIITANSALLSFLAVIGVIVLVFMAICVVYLVPIVYNTEEEGMFSSIGRTVELIKGKWLSTFAILFISSLIASIISFVFAIPNYIMTAMGFLHGMQETETISFSFTQSLAYGVTTFIATAGQYLLTAIPIIAIIFQYYNLVERRDASGLLERIDQMGTGKGEEADETF